jgi:hypothetical protein
MARYHPVMPTPRRFPPPWSVEEEPCFVVKDNVGPIWSISVSRYGQLVTGKHRPKGDRNGWEV